MASVRCGDLFRKVGLPECPRERAAYRFHVPLGHCREQRQRQRPGIIVLGPRQGIIAVAFAPIRLSMYRDVVYLGSDLSLAQDAHDRSEEHTSELQSLIRNSYAVFCL